MKTEMTTESTKEKTRTRNISLVSIGVGLALVGTGAFLFFGWPNSTSTTPTPVRCPEVTLTTLSQPPDNSGSAIKALQREQASVESLSQQWVSTGKKNTSIAQAIQAAAQKRKTALVAALAEDPAAVLTAIKTDGAQATVNQLTTNCLETLVDVSGTIQATVFDFDTRARTVYRLLTTTGQEYFFYPANQTKQLLSGDVVTVKGRKIDNTIVASGTAAPGEATSTVVDSAANLTPTGDFRTLVVPVLYSDSVTIPSLTPAQMTGVMFTNTGNDVTTGSVNKFYAENSYGTVSFSGQVITNPNPVDSGWFRVNILKADAYTRAWDVERAVIQAVDPLVNWPDYDRVVLAAAFSSPYAGWGTLGEYIYATAEGNVVLGFATIKASIFKVGVISHEVGHNFGEQHARMLGCAGGVLDTSGICNINEYGDDFDGMGGNYGHFSAPHKEYLNWLTAANIQTVTADGNYTFELMETDHTPSAGTTGIKALRIQRSLNDYVYLEYRQPVGYDQGFNSGAILVDVYDGALVHLITSGINGQPGGIYYPYLIEAGNTTSYVSLRNGLKITDPLTGDEFTGVSKTSTTATVTIKLGPNHDFVPPVTAITQPTPPGVFVAGTAVPLAAQLTDDRSGVQSVTFKVIGPQGTQITVATVTSPTSGTPTNGLYQTLLNTTQLPNGLNTLTVTAVDVKGNVAAAVTRSFQINNTDAVLPVISSTVPANSSVVMGMPFTASAVATDNIGVWKVEFRTADPLSGYPANLAAVDYTAPYSASIFPPRGFGPVVMTVRVYDYAQQYAEASTSFIVRDPSDTIPPSVTISSPTAGQSVWGAVQITVSAHDQPFDYMKFIEVFLDGVQIVTSGGEQGGPSGGPGDFTFNWDATTATVGTHVLTAGGWDYGGNYTLSAPVTINVSPGSGGGGDHGLKCGADQGLPPCPFEMQ